MTLRGSPLHPKSPNPSSSVLCTLVCGKRGVVRAQKGWGLSQDGPRRWTDPFSPVRRSQQRFPGRPGLWIPTRGPPIEAPGREMREDSTWGPWSLVGKAHPLRRRRPGLWAGAPSRTPRSRLHPVLGVGPRDALGGWSWSQPPTAHGCPRPEVSGLPAGRVCAPVKTQHHRVRLFPPSFLPRCGPSRHAGTRPAATGSRRWVGCWWSTSTATSSMWWASH